MHKNYTILAIETSLDETCAAVMCNERTLSNVISSQIELHKKYGGVVPIIAKRAHEERIDAVIAEALTRFARTSKSQITNSLISDSIDAIAVTVGPGQAIALEVGIKKAREMAIEFGKPLIAVSHMEGHLLSAFVQNARGHNRRNVTVSTIRFPLIGLLVSGGHTQLVRIDTIGQYQLLGETLDDAAGEAFDKVGRMLGIGYPGGPIIERLAKDGDEYGFDLPVPMLKRKDLNFSYSGLKTAVMYMVKDLKKNDTWSKKTIQDMAASFQRVLTESLIRKLTVAVKQIHPHGVVIGGGVISNQYVRRTIRLAMKKQNIPVYVPSSSKLCTDNAAMIGLAAYYKAQRGEFVKQPETLDRQPNLHFDTSLLSR